MDIVVKFVDEYESSYGLYRLEYNNKFVWKYINVEDRDGLIVCGNLINNDREMVVFDSIKFLESDIENLCKT